MPDLPAIDLGSLDGTDGFRLDGAVRHDRAGFSVALAGDVNGDGFDDLIVGAYGAAGGHYGYVHDKFYDAEVWQWISVREAGLSYVVFGHAGASPAYLNFNAIDGENGFVLAGVDFGDFSGRSVASAGDVNGDGFDDLIVGAYRGDPGGQSSGESYVVFGHAGPFDPRLDLFALDGDNGFRIDGALAGDVSGWSVASAGDVNGDGYDDVIVGAFRADPDGASAAGASYVVFGHAGGFEATLSLAALDGSNGFRLEGISNGDWSGYSVASAGDINGDGFDDLIVGANGADRPGATQIGESYVVFGHAGSFGSVIELGGLDGSNGFRLDGIDGADFAGLSVASAGDVNGDGIEDMIVGAPGADPVGRPDAGESYVVFGRTGGFGSAIDLAALDGSNGFRIDGAAHGDASGASVASAGDVNGDGYDDLIIGARRADTGGSDAGAAYVVFGHAGGPASISLAELHNFGFVLNGSGAGSLAGTSVASAGDLNGDGYDDLIVGAPGVFDNAGAAYVIYGSAAWVGPRRTTRSTAASCSTTGCSATPATTRCRATAATTCSTAASATTRSTGRAATTCCAAATASTGSAAA